MAIADTKKCQTMINIVGQQAQVIRAAVTKMKAVRTKFVQINPDTTGTPLEGTTAAVSNWIDTVEATANDAVATGLISAIVPTHRNKALEVD